MDDIIIKKEADHTLCVYQGDKNSGSLGYDEMLGLISALTMPEKRPCLCWMRTDKIRERITTSMKEASKEIDAIY